MFEVFFLVDGKWSADRKYVPGPRKNAMAVVRGRGYAGTQQVKVRKAK